MIAHACPIIGAGACVSVYFAKNVFIASTYSLMQAPITYAITPGRFVAIHAIASVSSYKSKEVRKAGTNALFFKSE